LVFHEIRGGAPQIQVVSETNVLARPSGCPELDMALILMMMMIDDDDDDCSMVNCPVGIRDG
jgi:hypothetical protein